MGSVDRVWELLTQDPENHPRWDVRFTYPGQFGGAVTSIFEHALHELSLNAVATYVIDGRGIECAAGFYRAVGEAVNGPGKYFGGSLGGLSDCLSGGMGSADGEIQFRWTHSEVARKALGFDETVRSMRTESIWCSSSRQRSHPR